MPPDGGGHELVAAGRRRCARWAMSAFMASGTVEGFGLRAAIV
jgi:hypothetical protein